VVSCSPETILEFPGITVAIRYRFAHLATPFRPLEDYDNVIFVTDESEFSDWEISGNRSFPTDGDYFFAVYSVIPDSGRAANDYFTGYIFPVMDSLERADCFAGLSVL
jgi:hypothetical protein